MASGRWGPDFGGCPAGPGDPRSVTFATREWVGAAALGAKDGPRRSEGDAVKFPGDILPPTGSRDTRTDASTGRRESGLGVGGGGSAPGAKPWAPPAGQRRSCARLHSQGRGGGGQDPDARGAFPQRTGLPFSPPSHRRKNPTAGSLGTGARSCLRFSPRQQENTSQPTRRTRTGPRPPGIRDPSYPQRRRLAQRTQPSCPSHPLLRAPNSASRGPFGARRTLARMRAPSGRSRRGACRDPAPPSHQGQLGPFELHPR